MSKREQIIKVTAFVCIGCLCFLLLQSVMISKVNLRTMSALEEFQESDDKFDVLFIGSSHMAYGVSPMQIYEQSGISSYNLATEAQTIALSHAILLEAFSLQKPKVVVLDAANILGGERGHDLAWQVALDSLPISATKVEMAAEYEENLKTEKLMFNALVPFVQYHTRWKDLDKNDFVYCFDKGKSYTKGYMVRSLIMDSGYDTDEMNLIHAYVRENTQKREVNYLGEEIITENPICVNEISEHNVKYVRMIKNLCEQNGAKLLVTKIPAVNMPTIYLSAWTLERYLLTKQLCEENDIEYFDLLYESDLDLDWQQDSMDGGSHLNIKGARKATGVLMRYLVENYEIGVSMNRQFEEDMPIYKKIEEVALLGAETDFAKELEMYNNHSNNWVMLMTVKKNCSGYVSGEVQQRLYDMNLKIDLNAIVDQSYLAIIDDKQIKEEVYSNRKITRTYKDENDTIYSVTSAGYFSDQQGIFSINGKNYALNGEGINVIIYDKESGNIVDIFSIDTGNENPKISRDIGETCALVGIYEQYCSSRYGD